MILFCGLYPHQTVPNVPCGVERMNFNKTVS